MDDGEGFNCDYNLHTGPELPNAIVYGTMTTSPDGNGVILVGGKLSSAYYSNSILELKGNGQGWVGAWNTLSTKLQRARSRHIVIPVLMNKDICGLDGIVPDESYTTTTPTTTMTTTITTTATTMTTTTTMSSSLTTTSIPTITPTSTTTITTTTTNTTSGKKNTYSSYTFQ